MLLCLASYQGTEIESLVTEIQARCFMIVIDSGFGRLDSLSAYSKIGLNLEQHGSIPAWDPTFNLRLGPCYHLFSAINGMCDRIKEGAAIFAHSSFQGSTMLVTLVRSRQTNDGFGWHPTPLDQLANPLALSYRKPTETNICQGGQLAKARSKSLGAE